MSGIAPYKAVVFDAFGTLVRVGTRLSPYRRLQQLMSQYGRRPQADDGIRMMTLETGLAGLLKHCGAAVPATELVGIEEDLYRELSSIRLYDDALPVIERARKQGLQLGLCSNLATPYGAVVAALLPDFDAYAWSFRIGAVKPDPRIYRYIATALNCMPSEILFVGDTFSADVEGPRAIGMASMHLIRGSNVAFPNTLRGLNDLFRELA